MAKYEKQGQTKIINSYGAVGTLIQTMQNGSLKIDNFDKWPYYTQLSLEFNNVRNLDYFINNPKFISDDRLVQKLQNLAPNISGIFRMPENEEKFGKIDNENKVISASLFPEWFFCPSCGKMGHMSKLIANNQMPKHCNMFMEQFSFVLISEKGEIADIPWRDYLTSNDNPVKFNTNLNDTDKNLILKYSTGGSAEFLETKNITATIDGKTINKSLGPLSSRLFQDQVGNIYKMAVRQGNNLCFVKTWSSLYIPKYIIPALERIIIKALDDAGLDINQIHTNLKIQYPNTLTTIDHLEAYLNPIANNDEHYKWEEFDFITNNAQNTYTAEDIEFNKYDNNRFGISNIYRINKLKVTHVQTGYTRLIPTGEQKKIYNTDINFYPGVEMFGEGMLLEMNVGNFNTFLNKNHDNNTEDIRNMMHSLSHCIMKELEFECGYPLNSLKERLYFGTEDINGVIQVKYAGILIYSATGSNSSFGGIAALFDNNKSKLDLLIGNSIFRAHDCPNDPICIDEEKNGNSGVCYSCNLIPETSCESFNSGLNRKLLIKFMNS